MILVFNAGSASLRWALFDKKLNQIAGERAEYPDFSNLEKLTTGILDSLDLKDLDVIGHRVVHGGADFRQPTEITTAVLSSLQKAGTLAPLHNPPALRLIKVCRETYAQTPNIACFDTEFFTNLPDYARLYPLPRKITEKYQLLRYGFHGLSHEYAAHEAAKKLKRPLNELRLITCHLGAGASITAIENGQPIDTSMGMTPLEGLMMSTRSGNIDPSIPLLLQEEGGLTSSEIRQMLNKESGLAGVSGLSGDVREILAMASDEEAEPEKKYRAGLALQMYAYRIKKGIGAYTTALGGLDALVLTGAVAEGADLVRGMITHGLTEVLGDFPVLVIPTNEELAIARKVSHALV